MPGRGDGEAGEGGAGPALPKLTIGQRLLAALPDLQRATTSGTRSRATGGGGGGGGAPDGGTDTPVKPDTVVRRQTTAGGSRTSGAASGRGGSAQRANPYADMSVAELRQSMKRLDDRERMLPLLLGPVEAGLDIALTFVALHNNPALHVKGHTAPSTIVAVGIGSAVIALLAMVAAVVRRRSFAIFALLFSGYGGGLVTMLPAWLVAGWLFVRFNRMQKALVAKTGGPQAARQAATKARNDRMAERRSRRGGKAAPAPAGPPPNKRYTPPKPTRPTPSR